MPGVSWTWKRRLSDGVGVDELEFCFEFCHFTQDTPILFYFTPSHTSFTYLAYAVFPLRHNLILFFLCLMVYVHISYIITTSFLSVPSISPFHILLVVLTAVRR
jgi:hypothetical protein